MMAPDGLQERLLHFEVGATAFALPIAYVVEVDEVEPLVAIPTLPLATGGAMNYHGDVLPVLRPERLLPLEAAPSATPAHVVVISSTRSGSGRLGLPVDRVLGFFDEGGERAPGSGPVAERWSLGDRVVSVLDPKRLVALAREVVEGSVSRGD